MAQRESVRNGLKPRFAIRKIQKVYVYLGYAMKYVIWVVRLWFAAWMIPAGLEHFIHIFPQPGSNSPAPLAHEMLDALLDSHLFDLVKAVELLAGISVLTGYYTPVMLLICMPVSFCVFWWDAPLSGWGSPTVVGGARVLGYTVVLCLAFMASYRSMFVLRTRPRNVEEPSSISQIEVRP